MHVRLVIPGHGDPRNSAGLARTVARILDTAAFAVSCVVYVYSPNVTRAGALAGLPCDVRRASGFWTDFMRREARVRDAHVLLAMDDVVPSDAFNTTAFVQTLERHRFDVLSAGVGATDGYVHTTMRPRADCSTYATNYIDMLFVLFAPDAWRCWTSRIDTRVNRLGWGYDVTFQRLCGVRIGVSHEFHVMHRRLHSSVRSYSRREALRQQAAWFAHVGARWPRRLHRECRA